MSEKFDIPPTPTFHWADYLVLGIFLLFSTLIGVFIGWLDRRKLTSKEFLLGGGDMHYIPVALSMQASFLSAIFILTTPTEIYNFGTMYSYLALSYFTALPLAAHLYLPTFHKLHLTSAYEVRGVSILFGSFSILLHRTECHGRHNPINSIVSLLDKEDFNKYFYAT